MGSDTEITRRSVLKTIGLTAVAATSLSGSAAAAQAHSAEGTVPTGLATKAANKQVLAASHRSNYSDWNGASVGRPTTYYRKNADKGPRYLPSAYVFPVMDGANSIGYVTISARRTEGPIIEYSTAQPPNEYLASARSTAAKRGRTEGVPLYHGGLKYGLAFEDGTAMNVMNGHPQPIGDGIARDALATNTAPTQWITIQNTTHTTNTGLVPNSAGNNVSTMSQSADYVPYVPAWRETDAGGGNSTSYGSGRDAWSEWDGCYPIAASMLIASHENAPRPENDDARERMIDRLHSLMNTNDGGWTYISDAVDGIRNYDYGDFEYIPNYTASIGKSIVRSDIGAGNPILLDIDGGSRFKDHMVTVVGYSNNVNTLRIHNTWDWSAHNFSWGNWSSAGMIHVYPS